MIYLPDKTLSRSIKKSKTYSPVVNSGVKAKNLIKHFKVIPYRDVKKSLDNAVNDTINMMKDKRYI